MMFLAIDSVSQIKNRDLLKNNKVQNKLQKINGRLICYYYNNPLIPDIYSLITNNLALYLVLVNIQVLNIFHILNKTSLSKNKFEN